MRTHHYFPSDSFLTSPHLLPHVRFTFLKPTRHGLLVLDDSKNSFRTEYVRGQPCFGDHRTKGAHDPASSQTMKGSSPCIPIGEGAPSAPTQRTNSRRLSMSIQRHDGGLSICRSTGVARFAYVSLPSLRLVHGPIVFHAPGVLVNSQIDDPRCGGNRPPADREESDTRTKVEPPGIHLEFWLRGGTNLVSGISKDFPGEELIVDKATIDGGSIVKDRRMLNVQVQI
ncbi:hypothetical protein BDM02DRAFT_470884 [Thelephora ganbajun]|uniref:Uncharacterized protein n=1 Tax=Thelephora ganbajun TaxID=370292 RepID=A0ACB6Z7V6_THEGA|nr:hypothetical protein BDM02DRAFT_470884 [Thelephora ganbajun]